MSDDERCDDGLDRFQPPPSLPPGVRKEVVKEADPKSYSQPKAGDEVTVDYAGSLEATGQEFDSSHKRDAPLTFTLGKGEVIKGLDLGVATMHKGEVAKFTLQPEYAYGEEGSVPLIPPNATLVFVVELVSWVVKDDLFGDGQVTKSQVEEGSGFDKPKKAGEVKMSLKVTAGDGVVTKDVTACDYVIGSGEYGPISKVVDKALLGMRAGDKVSLKCAKSSAYGDVTVDVALEDVYEINDVSLLKDKSVMKKKLKDGEGYEKPQDMTKATLRIQSVEADGVSQFTEPQVVSFVCGSGQVCDALEGAACQMKKGELARISCTNPAKSCDAELGAAVPGSKRTVITAELTDFKSGGDFSNLCTEDKLTLAGMRKDEGGKLFKSQRFELALAKYRKVVDELRDTNDTKNWPDEFKQQAKELKKAAELNKAACFLKLGDNLGTLSACNAVLKEDRNNVKAIFRRAKAHHGRAENVEAQRDLERVLELDPANADAKQLLPHVKKAQKKADAQGKNTFSKMCDAFGKMPERKEPKEEAARDPSPPKERSDVVSLTFRHELKPAEGETLCVYGSSEALGAWDQSKCVEMTLLPQKWEPPVGSGREPPKKYIWEVVVDVKEGEELVEYKYLMRGPGGNTLREEGQGHKCHVAGMGGTRQRLTDSWRK